MRRLPILIRGDKLVGKASHCSHTYVNPDNCDMIGGRRKTWAGVYCGVDTVGDHVADSRTGDGRTVADDRCRHDHGGRGVF